jgi:hypothetical protein
LWQWRDIFYGTLEFSARTLKLRDKHQDDGVVSNLIALLRESLQVAAPQTPKNNDTTASDNTERHAEIMNALQAIQEQLKSVVQDH